MTNRPWTDDHLKRFLSPKYLPLLVPFVWLTPVYLGGKALFWGTPALQFYVWWHQAAQTLLAGHLPLWNPLAGMGAPLFANYQSALLYPPVWLLLALDALGGLPLMAWAATLVVAAHLAWATWGMMRLLAENGLSDLAQGIGGLAFGMCGYLTARAGLFPGMIFAAAWLPWVLLAVQRLATHPQKGILTPAVRFLTLTAGLQLLSGHAQTTWYTFVLAGVWYLAYAKKQALRRAPHALLGFALAVLLAAPQLLATAEYLLTSQRAAAYAYEAAMVYSFWPWRLLDLFANGAFGSPAEGTYWGYAAYWEDALYLGWLPMMLVLLSLGAAIRRLLLRGVGRGKPTAGKRHSVLTALLVAPALTAFLLALGENTALFPWLYRHVPTFDMFQAPTRWNLWVEFALAFLAALAVEQWRRPEGRALYWARLGTAGAFAITLGAGIGWALLRENADLERLSTMVRAFAWMGLWALGGGLLTLFHAGPRRWFSYLVLGWLALDVLRAAWGLAPATGLDFYRQAANVPAQVRAMAQSDQRLYLPAQDEYRLKFKRFLRFDSFLPAEDWHAMRDTLLPNLFLPEGIASANNFDPLLPGNYAAWMDVLAQSSPPVQAWMLNQMSVEMVERVGLQLPFEVRFEERAGLPRARWAACGRVLSGQEDLWDTVNALGEGRETEPPGGPVLLPETATRLKGVCFPPGETVIQKIRENPQEVVFSLKNENPGWFILADVWYPQWQAYVDGERVTVWQADGLFRTVLVAAGAHTLRFVYRPWWRWTVLLSLAVLVAFGFGRESVKAEDV